jgi:hypothetical protein
MTCNQLDLEAIEFGPIMPKNLPRHQPINKRMFKEFSLLLSTWVAKVAHELIMLLLENMDFKFRIFYLSLR